MWFLWYLAVCAHLNGHNNEVGGAARVTDFREFIRFRVDRNGVTGYVISIEDKDRKEWLDHTQPLTQEKQKVARHTLATWDRTPAVRTKGVDLVYNVIDVFTVTKNKG
jgi:hypothetical protein